MLVLASIKRNKSILFLCLIFSLLYSILAIVRHNHFGSFGYDLGIVDQITWKFSHFKLPITTSDDTPYSLSLINHFELIFAFLSPIYWIWSDVRSLLILQAVFFSFSALPIFLFARRYKLKSSLCYVLAICYLAFFGVQNALWFDVHSAPFAAALMSWFIYFIDRNSLKLSILTFLLCIIAKENYAVYLVITLIVFYLVKREKRFIYFALAGVIYTILLFGVYFPYFVKGGYHYIHGRALFAGFNVSDLINTKDKRDVFFYSLLSFGFLPILAPLYLIPFLGNLASYFILGRAVTTAQGLFLQYRIDLAPLLVIATILTIAKIKKLNRDVIAIYLVICILVSQYFLHLPLSYLTKKWFWHEPSSSQSINSLLPFVPHNAPVVAQNNILSHLSHRDEIFTLWPRKKKITGLGCPQDTCDWLFWAGKPTYLIVDTSSDWDVRHFLGDPLAFKNGVSNLEKKRIIIPMKRQGTTTLYKILKQPS